MSPRCLALDDPLALAEGAAIIRRGLARLAAAEATAAAGWDATATASGASASVPGAVPGAARSEQCVTPHACAVELSLGGPDCATQNSKRPRASHRQAAGTGVTRHQEHT